MAKNDDFETITVKVRKDFPEALRDSLVNQLQRGTDAVAHPVVGNFADLQRMGAEAVAKSGGDETFRVHPDEAENAKEGAKRTLREEKAAKEQFVTLDGSFHTPEGPENTEPNSVDPGSQSPTVEGASKASKKSDK